MFLIFLQSEDILRLFIEDYTLGGWQDVAWNWILIIIAVAIVVAILMALGKYIWKELAPHPDKRVWSRGRSWAWFFLGIVPTFIFIFVVWMMTENFQKVVRGRGLGIGSIAALIIYLVIMLCINLFSGKWRTEMFSKSN